MIISVNDVLTLDDDNKYVVVSKVLHNDINYYYIIELDETEEDITDNGLIVKDGNNDELEVVEDEKELEVVQELLAKSFEINFGSSEE